MSFLSALVPFGPVLEKVFDRVFPDPAARASAELDVLKMQQAGEFKVLDALVAGDAGQQLINAEEAKSDSLFKSGWRPAVGWICALALACQFFLIPLLGWAATNGLGWGAPPKLQLDELTTILMGLLGLGAYRTYEKVRGVSVKPTGT
ncbi:MAG: holin family protein [Proteobacteria bacterium]|nr:holin family protein [Pseudomonadota bacterium]